MKKHKTVFLSLMSYGSIANLLTGLLLVSSFGAQATAPRINAQMFGEEKQAEIVGYQFAPLDETAKSDGEMAIEIITEAFKAVGAVPSMDVLPSKQLASYALINNDAVGFIGSPQDLAENPKIKYHKTVFFFRNNEPVSLMFSRDKRGDELHNAFSQSLQKIIQSGKYLEIMEKHRGKGQTPSDFVTRLKKQNPSWK